MPSDKMDAPDIVYLLTGRFPAIDDIFTIAPAR